MKYIFITAMAVSVNAIMVYMLGNKVFGVSLRLKSLMMCGFCALLLSLVLLPAMVRMTSMAGISGLFAIFTIIFAGFVAYYDDMKEINSPSNVSTAMEIELDLLPEPEDCRQNAFEDKGNKLGTGIMLVGLINENMESTKQSLLDSSTGQVVEIEMSTTTETSEGQLNSEPLLESIAVKSLYSESSVLKTVTETVETIISTVRLDDELEDIPDFKEDPMLISKSEVAPCTEVLALENSKATDIIEIAKSQPERSFASDSLDNLLESAFSYKERGEDSCALDTFKYALKLHQDKEIAPFLVIEIANLLKAKGDYDEAIVLLTESRSLPGLNENHGLGQDFINTIAYLRIIKNNLSENHFGSIPSSKIPTEILKKIDDEFREWRRCL